MNAYLATLRIVPKLGYRNVLRLLTYRGLTKAGIYRLLLPAGALPGGPYWQFPARASDSPAPAAAWAVESAQRVLAGYHDYFSVHSAMIGFPPDWHRDPFTGATRSHAGHWSEVDEFESGAGDVKIYWDPSRFEGLLRLALAWIVSGDERFRRGCETWLSDWAAMNPANLGHNWKCGQETAIRLMHTLLATVLLERYRGVRATADLRRLVAAHCGRIEKTMMYALAQDNNHGTSEAAALYIAGGWLRAQDVERAARWERLGRKWLEDRIAHLVLPDGSFSQASVNYHRLMLDTISHAEVWRRWLDDAPFSATFYARCRSATTWLAAMTDASSGEAPNLGGNDGARILVLHGLPYTDFRPSVALASAVFSDKSAYAPGPYNEPLEWLGIEPPAAVGACVQSQLFADGGYLRLQAGRTWLLLRLPQYRFRPSQADGLHLDLWHDGKNILRDGGTYSYNSGEPVSLAHFSGTAAHNTIQFDDRDQMPRIGRFLFGDWLSCERMEFDAARNTGAAAYRDAFGAEHEREVALADARCVVSDAVKGFERKAVLRWRLAPADWRLEEGAARSLLGSVSVKCSMDIVRMELKQGWESRHYHEKTPLTVLEVEVARPCALVSTIELA